MPDVKQFLLLAPHLSGLEEEVVVWVVDEAELLCAALGAGADAVISNTPLQLLAFLRDTHRRECAPPRTLAPRQQ